MDQPHSKSKHVDAIVRIDPPLDPAYPENSVAVVKVSMSELDADAEVSRLNQLNRDKGCVYISCMTRLIE
jgi:hypothetical protein